jgi:hypothetical protein
MKPVICDCCIDSGGCDSLLREVAFRKPCSAGFMNEVMCRNSRSPASERLMIEVFGGHKYLRVERSARQRY